MKKLLLIPIIFSFLIVGVVQAQTDDLPTPGILPDHPLYFLSSISETIGTAFIFGPVNKANRQIDLAEKRVVEAEALAKKGKSKRAEKAAARYENHLARALKKADVAKAKGKDADQVLARLAEATLRHQAVLIDVYERVPEQAKAAIERVIQKSVAGHEQALKNVSLNRKQEARARIEKKKLEIKEKLEALRSRGGPVPKMEADEEEEENESDD